MFINSYLLLGRPVVIGGTEYNRKGDVLHPWRELRIFLVRSPNAEMELLKAGTPRSLS